MKKLSAAFAAVWLAFSPLAALAQGAVPALTVKPANRPVGSGSAPTNQVSCASTATQVLAARTGAPGTGRIAATIENMTTTPIYVGGAGVTTSTGMLLPGIVGVSMTLNTTAALYCIVATGTAGVSVVETY